MTHITVIVSPVMNTAATVPTTTPTAPPSLLSVEAIIMHIKYLCKYQGFLPQNFFACVLF